MDINHKPATPLPWVVHEQGEADEYVLLTADRTRWVVAFRLNGEQYLAAQRQNAAYLIHAAHVYEKMVRTLRDLTGPGHRPRHMTMEEWVALDVGGVRALLQEIGEAS